MTFRPTAARIRLNLRPQRVSILLPIVAMVALLTTFSFDQEQVLGIDPYLDLDGDTECWR